MSLKPKVALSQDFLLNLARLPAAVQGKVLKWAIRFQTDPTASGFNYEKIRAARDSSLRSVRIDGDWRGIVFVPPRSDLYVLLYVDHHDAAYRWAVNRKLTINPVTGAMQVVLLEEVITTPEPAETAMRPAPDQILGHQSPFASLSDTEILSLGTPADLLQTSLDLAAADGRPDCPNRGRGVRVAPTAAVSRSVLWDDVTIGDGAQLYECVVADGVTIPDGASYRRSAIANDRGTLVVQPLGSLE